ncbi:VrrA/YqfQ family protein [Oceanobacillus damuensis]|uniref:VrrA/YqfQ family protein n=1 Tax=Oceanobacillus damuensis TaxID=937928 RepID=UPI00082FDD7B|nr:VrrA/YqfQ family protein [Oceanobacillus damuensis]
MLFPPRQQQNRYGNPFQSHSGNSMLPSTFKTKFSGGNTVNTISKTLDSVQNVLNMVESSAPLIQEYGPMVKNLPAMYRMMKAFKEIEASDEENAGTAHNKEETTDENEKEETPKREHAMPGQPDKKVESKGVSKPKLYI